MKLYSRVLRHQWKLIAAAAVLGALVSLLFTSLIQAPAYQAQTQLFVRASTDNVDSAGLNQSGQFAQQRVTTYVDVVTSPRVLGPVIDQLDLETSPDELARKVQANAPLDTVLINITVTDESAKRAAAEANAIGKQFALVVKELEKPGARATAPVSVAVLNPASTPSSPVGQSKLTLAVLGLLVGLFLGLGVALIKDATRNGQGV